MAGFSTNDAYEALAQELSVDPEEDRPKPHHIKYKEGWRPKLNPIQQMAFDDIAIFKLLYGERFTGKSFGALHELVNYLYRNDNGLAYIVVREMGMGTEGGAWHKLKTEVLPEWQAGLGNDIVYATDFNTKSPLAWVSNRHGGWSCVVLKSLPVAAQVEGKIRGREPGFIFIDEGQTLESDTYFTSLLMQLGRRRGNGDPSKLVIACNPEGPSHWLYKRFFEEPVDEKTGEWDFRYGTWHIPITDNLANLPPNYYADYVLPAVKNDPIAKARLVDGIWVDRPDGNSLLGDCFVEGIHVKGDAVRNIGLLPVVGQPIIISWDPGAAHTSIHFQQVVPTLEKIYKLTIDEIDRVGSYTPYRLIVPQVIKRLQYWEEKMKATFRFIHVGDESAFNQYRAATGSFDAWDIEKISKEYVEQNKLDPRFIIKMLACPKAEHSIEARVRLAREDFIDNSAMISAMCPNTIRMCLMLQEDPENKLKPKKKARWGHNLDSYTYGYLYFNTRRVSFPGAVDTIKPELYTIG